MKERSEQIKMREGDYTFFTVDREEYGIQTEYVAGVQETPVVRRVPKAPGFIEGVANIHGRILPVINTRNRVETMKTDQTQKTLILTQLEGVFYGLLADQVTSVAYLGQEMIEPVNPVLIKKEMPFIPAMAAIGDRLVHLLDLETLVYAGVDVDPKEKIAYTAYTQKGQKVLGRTKKTDQQRYIVMLIGQETYGLPIDALKEVVLGSRLEKLSGGPDYLAGIIKTPEGMIPVIDMQKKYDLELEPYQAQCRIVVFETEDSCFGILANAAWEMIGISQDEIKDTPKTIVGDQTTHIKNVAMLDRGKRLVIIMDAAKVLTKKDLKKLSKVEGVDRSRGMLEAKTTRGESMKSFLIFQVAGHEFAFDMALLVEVINYKTVSRIPKAPPHIRGLIPVKSELVPVIDLRVNLEMKTKGNADEKHIIIIRKDDALHGFIADRVIEILQVLEQDLAEPGDFPGGINLDAIEGIIRIKGSDRVPMVLKLEKVI